MYKAHRFSFTNEDDQEGADRQTASLAGLAFALLLVVIGLVLVHTLRSKAIVEDCLMSGRTNCETVTVDTSGGVSVPTH
jgi:hypothetical protein